MEVRKGSNVQIDLQNCANPDEFNPDRWDQSRPAHRGETDLTYLTFGQGPMKCPGADIAHTHAMVSYVHLLRDLSFEYIGSEPPKIKSLVCGEFDESMELLVFPRS
jgi:cytochrome P450